MKFQFGELSQVFKNIASIEEYFPDILVDIREFKKLAETENVELTILWNYVKQVFLDQYIENAGDYGVFRWENMLNIVPAKTETLDERKFRVLTYMKNRLPYTIRTLDDLVRSVLGADNYDIVLDSNEYRLDIKLFLIEQHYFDILSKVLEGLIPANIVLEFSAYMPADISIYAGFGVRELSRTTMDVSNDLPLPERIVITNADGNDEGVYWFNGYKMYKLTRGINEFQIEWEIYPKEAIQEVVFELESGYAVITDSGKVTSVSQYYDVTTVIIARHINDSRVMAKIELRTPWAPTGFYLGLYDGKPWDNPTAQNLPYPNGPNKYINIGRMIGMSWKMYTWVIPEYADGRFDGYSDGVNGLYKFVSGSDGKAFSFGNPGNQGNPPPGWDSQIILKSSQFPNVITRYLMGAHGEPSTWANQNPPFDPTPPGWPRTFIEEEAGDEYE